MLFKSTALTVCLGLGFVNASPLPRKVSNAAAFRRDSDGVTTFYRDQDPRIVGGAPQGAAVLTTDKTKVSSDSATVNVTAVAANADSSLSEVTRRDDASVDVDGVDAANSTTSSIIASSVSASDSISIVTTSTIAFTASTAAVPAASASTTADAVIAAVAQPVTFNRPQDPRVVGGAPQGASILSVDVSTIPKEAVAVSNNATVDTTLAEVTKRHVAQKLPRRGLKN